MKRLIQIVVLGLLLLSIGVVSVACSHETEGDQAVFGGSRIVREDESIDGQLAVFGGELMLMQDAEVNGDLTVFGGMVKVKKDAKVDGNLTVFGGDVTLEDKAKIDGDLINLGGQITRSEKSVIDGDVITVGGTEQDMDLSELADSLDLDIEGQIPTREEVEQQVKEAVTSGFERRSMTGPIFGFLGEVMSALLKTMAFGVLGLVLTLFLPDNVRRVGQAAEKAPVASAAVGCLSIPALAVLSVIAFVTIIGIPISFLIPFLSIAAAIFGWIGLGFFLGNRLLRVIEIRSPRPAAAAAIGASGLVLVGAFAEIIPLLGWLVTPFIGIWGLGATILTRGGRQSYPARRHFDRGVPPPTFDRLDELDFTPPPSPSSRGTSTLFADLAADLGITDEIFPDDDHDDKPNRPEKPVSPAKQ